MYSDNYIAILCAVEFLGFIIFVGSCGIDRKFLSDSALKGKSTSVNKSSNHINDLFLSLEFE